MSNPLNYIREICEVPRIRHALTIAAACTFLLVATTAHLFDILSDDKFIGIDFKSLYSACSAVLSGVNMYNSEALSKLAERHGIGSAYPFLYPPVFPYLFSSLARLSPTASQHVWGRATCIAYCVLVAGSIVGIRRWQHVHAVRILAWPTGVVLGLCLAFVLNLHNIVAIGQINVFVILLALPGVFVFRKSRHWPAVSMALAILIKVTPGFLLLVALTQGRLKFVLRTFLWLAILVLVTLLLGAGSAWIEFFKWLPKMSYGSTVPGLPPPSIIYNISLAGFFSRIIHEPSLVNKVTTVAMVALVIPILLRSLTAPPNSSDGTMLSACAILVIGSPISYIHHVMFLFPALLWYLSTQALGDRVRGVLALTLGVVSSIDFPVFYDRFHLQPKTLEWAGTFNLAALLGLYLLGLLTKADKSALAISGPVP